jgi:hypothetical protein
MTGVSEYLSYDGLSRNLTVTKRMEAQKGGGNLEGLLVCTIKSSNQKVSRPEGYFNCTSAIRYFFVLVHLPRHH